MRAKRWLGLAAVVAVGLACTGAASGNTVTYDDALIVGTTQSPDTTILALTSLDNGLIANVELDVPVGYTLDVGQPVGTKIADYILATQNLGFAEGSLTAADPTTFADPASLTCDAQTHVAVWSMAITGLATAVTVPWFVDAAPSGGYAVHVCFPASEFGGGAGGSPIATFALVFDGGALHAPTSVGTYVWNAFVTPFGADGQTPATAPDIEYQAAVPLPATLTLKSTYNTHTKFATVSGRLLIGGTSMKGYTIDIGASKTRDGDVSDIGTAATAADGTFSYPVLLTQSEYIVAAPETSTPPCTAPTNSSCFATETPFVFAETHAFVTKPKLAKKPAHKKNKKPKKKK